nr:zinc finger, CCHC-type [Tanacetum cinerariifolium]
MFEKQAGVKRFDLIQTFYACKQEEGKPVGPYVIKIKGCMEQLLRLGYVLPQDISVGLILNGLTSDFAGFVRNYNMHSMGKIVGELHALLIEYEKDEEDLGLEEEDEAVPTGQRQAVPDADTAVGEPLGLGYEALRRRELAVEEDRVLGTFKAGQSSRQAYLVETDTESEPFEDPVETKTPESPHTVASPTLLPNSTPPTRHAEESGDSDTSDARSTPLNFTISLSPDHPFTHTTPTLVLFLYRTARMAVHVPPTMSHGLSTSIAKVAAMSDSAFCTSELVEDDKDEDDEENDEGPAIEDEGPARAAQVVETAVGEPLGLGYEALRCREIALREGQMPSVFEVGQGSGSVPKPERLERVLALRYPTLTAWIDPEDGRVYIDVPPYPPPTPPVQTPPSLEWSSGSLPVSPVPSIVPLPISSPMIPLTIPSLVASPATAEAEGFLTELGTQTNAQRAALWHAALWHAISDTQIGNRELRL